MNPFEFSDYGKRENVMYLLLDRGGIKMDLPVLPIWANEFLNKRSKLRQQSLTWLLTCRYIHSTCGVKRIIGHDMVREITKAVWEERFQ